MATENILMHQNSYKSDSVFIMTNIMRVLEGSGSGDVGRRSLVAILLRGMTRH
jgi:hypothetical protein